MSPRSAAPSLFEPTDAAAALPHVEYDFPTDRKNWSRIAFVGEAPGKEEARLGHPFVGRSGQLLNEMLVKAGIDRPSCLVANVFRIQPPGNKVDHFFASRRAALLAGKPIAEAYGPFGSSWCLEEFTHDIKNLAETLQAMSPRIIIALGRTPLWALTGEGGLLSKVGQTFDCRLAPGIPVIPTYHPSFILRGNWKLQDQWLDHLILAAAQ